MLKKGFLRNRYPVKISTLRLWISIFFGVATALGLYFFFSVFRDVFRMMDFSISNGPLLIDKSERFWQNINFAMLCLVLGNSIAIGLIFKRPIRSAIPDYKRLTIQNDQTFFGFNFFYVFFKIYILLGVFSASFYDVKEITNNILLFILLSIAIFFESWKTIVLLYRRKVYRFLLLNVLVLTILTFVFGQINMLDINKLDSLLLTNNPRIELPSSSFHNEERNASCFIKIVKEDDTLKYFVDDLELSFEELPKRLNENRRFHYIYNLQVYLLAPYNISISEIKKLEKLLFMHNNLRVKYIIQRPEPEITNRHRFYGIQKSLFFQEKEIVNFQEEINFPPPPPPPVFFRNFEAYNIVKIKIAKNISFNDTLIKEENLLNEFKDRINSKTIFHFVYSDSLPYQKYITVYSNFKQAIFELREDEEIIKKEDSYLSRSMRYKYEDDQKRLIEKYPTLYIENYIFDE